MDSTSKVCSNKINPNFSTTYFLFLLVMRGASRVRLFTNQLEFKNKKNADLFLSLSTFTVMQINAGFTVLQTFAVAF